MSNKPFRISTTFSKSYEDPEVLEFVVECRPITKKGVSSRVVGKLEGFIVEPGYLPEEDDDWYFAAFDERSGHAADAYQILVDGRSLIGVVLPNSDLLDTGAAVAMLERAWIEPKLRGKGLALRLMREAQHVLGRWGLLVMLKAHPDGDDVSPEDCLRLAGYYASDEQLGLRHLSPEQHPGWLVGYWGEPKACGGDDAHWYAR